MRVMLSLLLLLLTAAAKPAIQQAVILSCYDGDTCQVDRELLPGRDRVQLANADSPEILGRCAEEVERALVARDYTRSLVVGRIVTLTAIEPVTPPHP